MVTEETIFDALRKEPYVQVGFPIPRPQLEEAVTSFLEFLELPDSLKNHIDLKIAPLHRRGDIGFKHRDPNNDPYDDSKDFFHFHPLIFEKYKDFLNVNPVIHNFMMQAKPIWDATYEIVQQIMKLIDRRFNGASAKIFDTDEVHILLRFLKYNWNISGKYLAKPHFDAGSFTLAIAESCPGLRIGRGPDDLKVIDHKEGHTIFMVSSNFKKILDTDDFSPGWHDVIQLDETQIDKPFSRWAIVAFIEGANVEALPRSETHKWYRPEVA
jgi:isopenicillin N synthase-like dioxygenase